MPAPLQGAVPGRVPDGQAESDLVDDVSKVVHQVQRGARHGTAQVPEEVAERVDRPADGDDEAHGVEGCNTRFLKTRNSAKSHIIGSRAMVYDWSRDQGANLQDACNMLNKTFHQWEQL